MTAAQKAAFLKRMADGRAAAANRRSAGAAKPANKSAAAAPAKRGRGRPRKTPVNKPVNAKAAPVKRGRGRPRKTSAPVTTKPVGGKTKSTKPRKFKFSRETTDKVKTLLAKVQVEKLNQKVNKCIATTLKTQTKKTPEIRKLAVEMCEARTILDITKKSPARKSSARKSKARA